MRRVLSDRIDNNTTIKIPVPRSRNINDVSGLQYTLHNKSFDEKTKSFDEGYRPEISVIFLLRGNGTFIVVFLSKNAI